MTDIAASVPDPTLTPIPVPSSATAPTPGYKTSEAWLTFLTLVVGAIPNSGLVADAPVAAKIVGMAIAALSVLNYTANRTSLKRAHLASDATSTASSSSSKLQAIAGSVAAVGVLVLAILYSGSPASASPSKASSGAGPSAGVMSHGLLTGALATPTSELCAGRDLNRLVDGKSLLVTVADDLVATDYEASISALIVKLGDRDVACATLVVAKIASAGMTSGAAALSPLDARARSTIERNHWGSL